MSSCDEVVKQYVDDFENEVPADFAEKQKAHREILSVFDKNGYFANIDQIAELSELISLNHGFGKKWELYVEKLGFEEALICQTAKAQLLQHSEISEGVEESRLQNINFENWLTEQADVIIRCLNMTNFLANEAKKRGLLRGDFSIGKVIRDKTAKNIERAFKHAGQRF